MKHKQISIPIKFKIILTLFSFAVAQPLFDILNKNQEFFIASNFSSFKVLIFAFLFAFATPLVLFSIIFFLTKIYKPLGEVFFVVFSFMLVYFFSMIGFSKISFLSGLQFIITTSLFSVIFTLLLRSNEVKKIVSFLSISSIIFFGVFLIKNKLIIGSVQSIFSSGADQNLEVENPDSIFIIVFDEFPVNSLLDVEGNIDKTLFPNFAALLNEFTWYSNTTTVTDSTTTSIPAILTGNYPKADSLPTYDSYPNNLFSLLSNEYYLFADEPYTDLCPPNLCTSSESNRFSKLPRISSDLFLLYKYLVLPKNLKNTLPFNNDKWNNFNKSVANDTLVEEKQKDIEKRYSIRDDLFDSFLKSIEKKDKPSFYFHHIELPHIPFNFSPSGKIYRIDTGNLGLNHVTWGPDEWLIEQNYQKHLLQVGFTDKLLGQFIDKLKSSDIYEESIVIIVADHGVSFTKNEKRRALTETNFQEIVSIPLFIKSAFQEKGGVNEVKAETIDIVPTIIDQIKLSKQINFDGKPLSRNNDNENRIVYYNQAKNSTLINENLLKDKQRIFLKNKYTNTNTDSDDFNKIYKIGRHPEIYGERVEKFYSFDNLDASVSINNEYLYETIDLSAYFIPSLISGYINSANSTWSDVVLAVSVNGFVGATTQATQLEDGRIYWSAIVDETLFNEGSNTIEIFQVLNKNGKIELLKFDNSQNESYLMESEQKLVRLNDDGTEEVIEVIQRDLGGLVDSIDYNKQVLELKGWAIDSINKKPAKYVVLFVDKDCVGVVEPTGRRADVAKKLDNKNYLHSGYNFALSRQDDYSYDESSIRVFAISEDNVAWELIK